jgi:hypothetical protein
MAERSIGMASGAGDGIVGGYPANRMTAKDATNFGQGRLLTGSYLEPSGAGSTTLAVAAGGVYVNGFFYENTSSLTFSTSTVAAGTYYIVCRVNDTASPTGVIASASGTTIPARSVRICVVSIASYTIATDVLICVVYIGGGGVISSFAKINTFVATGTTLAPQVNTVSSKTTTQNITAINTPTLVTWQSGGLGSVDGLIVFDAGNHRLMVQNQGLYMIQVRITMNGGTSGTRALWVKSTGAEFEMVFPHVQQNVGSTGYSQFTAVTYQNINVSSGIYVEYESSVLGVTLSTPADFRLARL